MAKRIYGIIAAIALVIIIYLIFNPHAIASRTLLWSVSILYALLVGSIHGILGHSLSERQTKRQFDFLSRSNGRVIYCTCHHIYT